jgi:hypothetical protein
MLTLTLSSKNDVHDFKRRFRALMDAQGIRLGKSNQKIDAIIPQLFGVRDIDTMYGLAEKSSRVEDIGEVDQRKLGGSTHKQQDELTDLIRKLENEEGIKRITIGRRNNVGCNRFGLTFVIETHAGIRRVDTGLTMEREPRELEVLKVFYQMMAYGLEEGVMFALHAVGDDKAGTLVDYSEWSTTSFPDNLLQFWYTMSLGDFNGDTDELDRAREIMRLERWREVVSR